MTDRYEVYPVSSAQILLDYLQIPIPGLKELLPQIEFSQMKKNGRGRFPADLDRPPSWRLPEGELDLGLHAAREWCLASRTPRTSTS